MSYVAAAAAGACALGLVNLWLIIAVARKLRQHGRQLEQGRPGPGRPPGLPPGTQVPGFSVTTVTGAAVSLGDLHGEPSLIAFFSPGCAPCRNQLPAFAAVARDLPGGAAHVLAVICGDGYGQPAGAAGGDGADYFIGELAAVAHVVREAGAGGTAATVMSVSGFPRFFRLDAEGRVEASGRTADVLSRPARV